MSMRRDISDPSKLGVHANWGFSWPANRRVLYNRASADAAGKPWSDRKRYVSWNGASWTSPDVPDYGPTVKPEANVGAFIMNPEGVARLFTRGMMRDGPFPEHYEPFESPVANALHPKTQYSPVARVFKVDMEAMGKPDKFPYVATTYRLTEHFHYWTKNQHINMVLQPELFVELPEALAKEKGIQPGGWVKISSNRGMIKAKAVITKRLPTLMVDGKAAHVIGLPIHYGFVGAGQKGYSTNILTPSVGDANVNTPEYKAFLVNVEPTTAPAAQPVA
jgi:formate dehydrogenase major subunit